MSVPRWMATWIVVVIVAVAVSIPAGAQTYGVDLPEGVEEVTIDGLAINATTAPEVNNRRPVIRGLLVPGPTEIELAIRPPDDLRWTDDVDPETGIFEATTPVDLSPGTHALYINDDLIGEFVVAIDGQLDLPAMSLVPSDIGQPGFGVVEGRWYAPIDQARRFVDREGEATAEQIQEAVDLLIAAGWEQRYERRLAVPSEEDELTFATSVELSLTAYSDANNAAAALAVLEGGTTVEDTPPIGEGAFISSGEGSTEAGASYRWRSINFRVENLLADIIMLEFTEQEPDADELLALAAALEQRINLVLTQAEGGLSTLLLRPDLANGLRLLDYNEGYEYLDGELIPFFAESDRSVTSREARRGEATTIYGAQYRGQLSDGNEEGGNAFIYAVILHRLDSADDASTWMGDLQQRIAEDPLPGYFTFQVLDDPVDLGDEAAVFRFTQGSEGVSTRGYRVYVQVGADIAQVELSVEDEPPLSVVMQVVEDQVRCITAGACTERLSLPDILTDGPPATPQAKWDESRTSI